MANSRKSLHVKTGDRVIVTAGKDKGKTGNIKKAIPSEGQVIVEGVNLRKKHLKPKNNNGTGEIVETEAPIHVSNVQVIDPKSKKASRVGFDVDKNGKKIRIAKKSHEKI